MTLDANLSALGKTTKYLPRKWGRITNYPKVQISMNSLQEREHSQMFVTTTIAVIYWTVFIQGTTVKPLVKLLHVKTRHV